MSQIYFCYVRDFYGRILQDGMTDNVICMLSSLDFGTLVNHGFSIEIIDLVDSSPRQYYLHCRRVSRRITQYIINYNKLPNKKRL